MKTNMIQLAAAATLAAVSSNAARAATEVASDAPPTTIVLAHGAFADGSAWADVIPLLQEEGHRVVAVQNTLTSLAADIETTRRAIESQPGPVIAVGHSYGGAVITGAAAGSQKVKALVYVAAFAPDAGEVLGPLYEKFGKPDLLPALRTDPAGFLTIDPARLKELFAHDVSDRQAAIMGATQKPIHESAFGESVERATWKDVPAYYLLATGDRAIKPELQRFMAERAGAAIQELDASHVPFLSQPQAVAAFILKAAREAAR